jgi:hypothetical protein
MTIQDGLYSLTAMPRDGAGDEVRGVLIFHDGTIHGGKQTGGACCEPRPVALEGQNWMLKLGQLI